MTIYIIAPFILAIVILLFVKIFGNKFPTQQEIEEARREKEKEIEKEKKERLQPITKFREENSELDKELREHTWELFEDVTNLKKMTEAQKKAFFKDFFKIENEPNDEQNE